jgi:CRP-like cAMP-binding protein
MLSSTPYTMITFMIGGQALVFAAIVLLVYTIVRDVRSRLDSVIPVRFAAGEIVFRQGDVADRLFIIGTGEVEAIREDPDKGEVVLGKLGPEDYFGEGAILADTTRSATIRAITDVEAISIHRSDFRSLYSALPHLREDMQAEHARRRKSAGEAISGAEGT